MAVLALVLVVAGISGISAVLLRPDVDRASVSARGVPGPGADTSAPSAPWSVPSVPATSAPVTPSPTTPSATAVRGPADTLGPTSGPWSVDNPGHASRDRAAERPARAARSTVSPSTDPSRRGADPAPSQPTPNDDHSIAEQVLALVNQERSRNGCQPVTLNPRLTEAAQRHSEDQAEHGRMSHTGSDGSTFRERAARAGYEHAIAENVAYGYPTADAVMAGWMSSPGHRANILNCAARAMGLGVATARDGSRYWTLMFGSVP